MNAVFIRKRNDSLQWLWTCLAGAELLVWISSCSGTSKIALCVMVPSILLVPLLIVSAFVHYVFACERYLTAKNCRRASAISVSVFLVSLFVAAFCTICFLMSQSALLAYAAFPAVFALGALVLKMIPDRSLGD